MAVVSTVLAFIAFLRGLAVIGPVRTAIMSTIEPFWTALLGALVLRQALGPRTLAGGLCIAAAVVLLQLGQGERRRRSRREWDSQLRVLSEYCSTSTTEPEGRGALVARLRKDFDLGDVAARS